MRNFIRLQAKAVPLDMINVDTDLILPKQFLKTITKDGLGKSAFFDLRYDATGAKRPDFVLNKPEYAGAKVLISGQNFGCGSSREHAPWAILDLGFRCIIAPSFADIFYNNCLKNGLLPVVLGQDDVHALMDLAKQKPESLLSVDLEDQSVGAGSQTYSFDIDSFHKRCLLEGLDDIGLTLEKSDLIDDFERRDQKKREWL